MDENPYKVPADPFSGFAGRSIVSGRAKFIRWFLVGAFIIYPILFVAIAVAGAILGWLRSEASNTNMPNFPSGRLLAGAR